VLGERIAAQIHDVAGVDEIALIGVQALQTSIKRSKHRAWIIIRQQALPDRQRGFFIHQAFASDTLADVTAPNVAGNRAQPGELFGSRNPPPALAQRDKEDLLRQVIGQIGRRAKHAQKEPNPLLVLVYERFIRSPALHAHPFHLSML